MKADTMTQMLRISDRLYQRLDTITRKRGLNSIEQLLEELPFDEDDFDQRRVAVGRLDALREQLSHTYGEMPDSVSLIQEDRAR